MEFRNLPSSVENERLVKLTVIDDRGNIPLRLSMRSATVHASSHPDDTPHHASGDALGLPPFQACLHGCLGAGASVAGVGKGVRTGIIVRQTGVRTGEIDVFASCRAVIALSAGSREYNSVGSRG